MRDQVFSHYRIRDQLGSGAMGVVYRAEDLTLRREVAVKFLPATLATNRRMIDRFRREARAAAALNHPEHLHDLRSRRAGRPGLYRDGAAGGSDASAVSRRRAADRDARAGHRGAGRSRAWRGAREGHHPPRHQAGEHLCRPRRADQDSRLWDREAQDGVRRRRPAPRRRYNRRGRPADRGGGARRDGRVHVPGTGAWRIAGYAVGSVFVRRRPVRTVRRPRSVHRSDSGPWS